MNDRITKYTSILQKYFGYPQLKPEQINIIDSVINDKKDVSAILATGFGKSICYQIPFLITKKSIIVVSPLIALMEDQYNDMKNRGIPVCCLNSNNKNKGEIELDIMDGANKIIYITPEYLLNCKDFIQELYSNDQLALFAIDESHCVSSWGLDFRKDYTKLYRLRRWAPTVPILALTATATDKVRDDICEILRLNDPYIVTGGFDRPNLFISVGKKTNEYDDLKLLMEKYKNEYSIIYCKTRNETDKIAKIVTDMGVNCRPYHAGMETDDRNKNQKLFINGDIKCMVATIAFGLGINVPNIRLVVHYNCPKNLESYYQEIGRAGRDGKTSECYLFFSAKDFLLNRKFLNEVQDENHRNYQEKQINKIEQFVYSNVCRRLTLLQHFDETPKDFCDNCDNCKTKIKLKPRNFAEETKLVYGLLNGITINFGTGILINILRGSNNQKMTKDLKTLTEYGCGMKYTEKWWKDFFRILINNGYLCTKGLKSGFGSTIVTTGKGYKWYKADKDELILMINDEFDKQEPTVLNEYNSVLQEFGLTEEDLKPKPISETSKKLSLSETKFQSYKMFQHDNKSIIDIAKDRNIQKQTVETHLVDAFKLNMPLNLEKVGFNKNVHKLINKTLSNNSISADFTQLKLIKEKLPKSVSYLHIRLSMLVTLNNWEKLLDINVAAI
jgi:Werner syndrome ATP-dependent helicase